MKIPRSRAQANIKKTQFPSAIELRWIEKLKDDYKKIQNKTYVDYKQRSGTEQQLMLKLGTKSDVFTPKSFDAPNFWRLYFSLTNETKNNFLNEVPRYVTPDTTTILGLLTLATLLLKSIVELLDTSDGAKAAIF